MFPVAARRLRGAPAVDVSRTAASQRAVEMLEIPAGNLKDTLSRAIDIVAAAVSGRPREGGLGLGPYLAKRIAALHGGDL